MNEVNKISKDDEAEMVSKLFQEAMIDLKKLHEEKLELIKKFRAEKNIKELNKIRETLKEQA